MILGKIDLNLPWSFEPNENQPDASLNHIVSLEFYENKTFNYYQNLAGYNNPNYWEDYSNVKGGYQRLDNIDISKDVEYNDRK